MEKELVELFNRLSEEEQQMFLEYLCSSFPMMKATISNYLPHHFREVTKMVGLFFYSKEL